MYDPMTFEYNIEYFNNFLDDFKDYQTIVEEKLLEDSTEKFHKYQSKLDGEIDLKSKADIVNSKEEFFEFLDNNYNNIIDRYSKIEEFRKQIAFYSYSFRSSLLVQIFSVFEHELIKICDEFHKKITQILS